MAWLLAPVYDRLVAPAEQACFGQWRQDLLASAHGNVVEIGAGTGVNIARYPSTVGRVSFTEPDPGMRKQLVAKLEAARGDGTFRPPDAEVRPDPAAHLTFANDTFDVAVTTLVLCTVPDPDAVLAEIRRVLKPGATLLFMEHVAAEDRPDRLKWQRRIDPIWRRVAGGCRLTRRTADTIGAAGFTIEDITRESARKASPLVRPTIRGTATTTA